MKIAIIVNYMDYQSTISATLTALKSGINRVVIVDNGSSNESLPLLKQTLAELQAVTIIAHKSNVGYARGNNLAVEYINQNFGRDNILFIINPDVQVNEMLISVVSNFILSKKFVGAVTGKNDSGALSCWPKTTVWRDIFGHLPIVARHVNLSKFSNECKNTENRVDVVTGAFFGIDQTVFNEVEGFDERTFLYVEEEILSEKLSKINRQNYFLNSVSFKHIGETSSKATMDGNYVVRKAKIINASRQILLEQYYHMSKFEKFAFLLVNQIELDWLRLKYWLSLTK